MISPQTLLAWVDALGWTLLHFLWQGAALGVLYAALRPFCRDVASRYRLGMALLVAMLFSPILTLAYLASLFKLECTHARFHIRLFLYVVEELTHFQIGIAVHAGNGLRLRR